MTNRLLHTALCLITILLGASSCSSSEGPDTPTGEPVERTVLIYMAAVNDLGDNEFDSKDLSEIKLAISTGDLRGNRLLVCRARQTGKATLEEYTAGGRVVTLRTYEDGLTAIHGRRMATVIADARRLAPSSQFGLILWSHSRGWLQNGINDPDYPAKAPQRSWGDERGRTMNITVLAEVLAKEHPDFVWFDCCEMASVEVAYELRQATDFIVASATELRAEGMPYDRTLRFIMAPGEPDLVTAASRELQYFNDKTDPEERSCTISVIATEGMDNLAAVAAEIHAATTPYSPEGYTPQPFMVSSLCYFYDLGDYMHALCRTAAGADALTARWDDALSRCVLYAGNTPRLTDKIPIRAHCGLSTYILRSPSDAALRGYNTLSWPYAAGILSR